MKRRWNFALWTGFLVVVVGLMSYVPVFAQFPVTRDFPWVNLLLLLAGVVLLGAGLKRAFGQPELFRGKIFGPLLALLSLAGIGLFFHGLFYRARQIPASTSAPRVGQKAPDFTLPDQDGKPVALADLLKSAPDAAVNGKTRGVLLIFYRGFW